MFRCHVVLVGAALRYYTMILFNYNFPHSLHSPHNPLLTFTEGVDTDGSRDYVHSDASTSNETVDEIDAINKRLSLPFRVLSPIFDVDRLTDRYSMTSPPYFDRHPPNKRDSTRTDSTEPDIEPLGSPLPILTAHRPESMDFESHNECESPITVVSGGSETDLLVPEEELEHDSSGYKSGGEASREASGEFSGGTSGEFSGGGGLFSREGDKLSTTDLGEDSDTDQVVETENRFEESADTFGEVAEGITWGAKPGDQKRKSSNRVSFLELGSSLSGFSGNGTTKGRENSEPYLNSFLKRISSLTTADKKLYTDSSVKRSKSLPKDCSVQPKRPNANIRPKSAAEEVDMFAK
eukprot:sb/3466213/